MEAVSTTAGEKVAQFYEHIVGIVKNHHTWNHKNTLREAERAAV